VSVPAGEMERRVRVDGVGGGPPQALDQAGVRPDQELDGLEAAVLGGQVEGGLAPAVPDAGVAGVLQQEADDGGVSVLCGAVQRRFVVFGLERNETRKLQLSPSRLIEYNEESLRRLKERNGRSSVEFSFKF
jgi:hypothetical protein